MPDIEEPIEETPMTNDDTTTTDTGLEGSGDDTQEQSSDSTNNEDGTTEVAEESITFDDFKNARDGVEKSTVKEAVKKQAKELEKPVEETETEAKIETKAEVPAVKPAPRDSFFKDFNIPPEKQKALRQMSNDAFNIVKETFTKTKELETKLAEAEKNKTAPLYSHPKAYTLTPEYEQASQQIALATSVESHWDQQLQKIAAGEPWIGLEADENGKIYTVAEAQEPTDSARVHVMEQLRAAKQFKSEQSRKVQELSTTYSQKHNADVTFIKETENKFFPDYDKPDHKTQPLQKEFIQLLPAAFRDHPLASTLAKTVANNAMFAKENKQLREENAKLKSAKPAPAPQNPTKGKLAGASPSGKPVPSFEDFQRIRAGEILY